MIYNIDLRCDINIQKNYVFFGSFFGSMVDIYLENFWGYFNYF